MTEATNDKNYPGVDFVKETAARLLESDDFEVKHGVDEGGVFIRLIVPGENIGRVIGKKGSQAGAMRILLRGIGAHSAARYTLKIETKEEAAGEQQPVAA